MPVGRCSENGKSGWRWGEQGKCYTYTSGDKASEKAAKLKAIRQGLAAAYAQGKKPEL